MRCQIAQNIIGLQADMVPRELMHCEAVIEEDTSTIWVFFLID